MGRNRVTLSDYCNDFPEIKLSGDILYCKTSSVEITPSRNRIKEHLESKKHLGIVEKLNKQPKLEAVRTNVFNHQDKSHLKVEPWNRVGIFSTNTFQ